LVVVVVVIVVWFAVLQMSPVRTFIFHWERVESDIASVIERAARCVVPCCIEFDSERQWRIDGSLCADALVFHAWHFSEVHGGQFFVHVACMKTTTHRRRLVGDVSQLAVLCNGVCDRETLVLKWCAGTLQCGCGWRDDVSAPVGRHVVSLCLSRHSSSTCATQQRTWWQFFFLSVSRPSPVFWEMLWSYDFLEEIQMCILLSLLGMAQRTMY